MQINKAAVPASSYNQSSQHKRIEFAFAHREGDTATELFQPFICRDYFNDVLYAEQSGQDLGNGIYGFRYDPKKTQIDRDRTRISVQLPHIDMKKLMQNNINIIHEIEDANGFERTDFIPAQDRYMLIEGDKKWMDFNHRISLYTFLIKATAYPFKNLSEWETELTGMGTNESSYMSSVSPPKFRFLSRNLNKIVEGVTDVTGGKITSIETIHNGTGFRSTFANTYWKPPYDKMAEYNIYRVGLSKTCEDMWAAFQKDNKV